jgi:hypothetical protein
LALRIHGPVQTRFTVVALAEQTMAVVAGLRRGSGS